MALTAITLGAIGVQAVGGLISASQRRKQLRQQARLREQQVQETLFRSELNIQQRQQEAQFAQRQAQSVVSSSGVTIGGATSLAHMNQIANQIARETVLARRETDFSMRAGMSEAAAMRQEARGGFLETINILAGAGIQSAQTWQMRPREGAPTPRQEGDSPALLDLRN